MTRLLIVSDIHGSISRVKRLEAIRRDVTVVAGDLARCGSLQEALEILETLEAQGTPVVWVPGNCDAPETASLQKAVNIHATHRVVKGLVFAGVGGSLYTPFNTPFEYGEEELARLLEKALSGIPHMPLVLVVHTPPYGSGLDRVSSGDYVGSRVVVETIRRHRPVLVATGHIHEAWGIACVEGSPVVNPGPLSEGRYAVADIDALGDHVVVRVRTLKQ